MNLFRRPIEEGLIRDRTELKKRFRRLALSLHPDPGKVGDGGRAFMSLRRDYEEAMGWLPAVRGEPKAVSREALLDAFWDLEASGFPLDASIRNSSRIYRKRIAGFAAMLSGAGALGGLDFLEVEAELNALRDQGIVDNPLFGKVRMIFYNIVAWQLEPKEFTRSALERWRAEAEEELAARGMAATQAFIAWLVADLGRGPALATS